MKTPINSNQSGMTLVEILVSTAVASLCLAMAYVGFMAGLNLLGKNMAINLTTLQTRNPLEVFVRDLQESVSIPELIDADFALYKPISVTGADGAVIAISGTTASPGVRFQVPEAGPFRVAVDTAANATSVQLEVTGSVPALSGDALHLVIPTHRVDVQLSSVSVSGTRLICNLKSGRTLSKGSGTFIRTTSSGGAKLNVGAYITGEKRYYVKDGEFLLSEGTGTPRVLAKRVLTPRPFSRPTGRSVGVLFGTSNAEYDNQKFLNTDILYQFEINYRGQLYN